MMISCSVYYDYDFMSKMAIADTLIVLIVLVIMLNVKMIVPIVMTVMSHINNDEQKKQ